MSEQPVSFHYAVDGQRMGPVTAAQFEELVLSGVINDTTLVWNEAFTQWKPYAEFKLIAAQGYARCAVSGALRPISEMVAFGEQYVSAEHRDEFFQRVKEGVGTQDAGSRDPVELRRKLDEEGFNTSAGSIISRSFNLWKNHFGLVVGVVVVSALISGIAGQVPFVGLLASLLLAPHLGAGCQTVLARKVRGEEPSFDSLFDPLKKQYGVLVLFGLVQGAIAAVLLGAAALVGIFGFGFAGMFEALGSGAEPEGAAIALFVAFVFVVAVVMGVIFLRLSFAPILIADKGIGLGDALKLSWKASGMRIWTLIAAMIVLSIMAMTGVIALFVGIFLTMAFPYVGMSVAYDDAFGSRSGGV